jgi:hypothetical protein
MDDFQTETVDPAHDTFGGVDGKYSHSRTTTYRLGDNKF